MTQAWQTRACQTPVRDAGPMSRSVNIALIVIAAIFVAIRFLSRWRGQGTNTLGWDDWTILASFLLLIPSTTILQISSFLIYPLSTRLVVLTCAYSDFYGIGSRHLDRSFRRHHIDVQGMLRAILSPPWTPSDKTNLVLLL